MKVKTKLDYLEKFEGKVVSEALLEKELEIPQKELEKILEWLESEKVIELYYLPIPFTKPSLRVLPLVKHVEEQRPPRKGIREKYSAADEDGLYKAQIYIYEDSDGELTYFLDVPSVGPVTSSYLKKLKDEIALYLPAETYIMTEEERRKKIYSKQLSIAMENLLSITDRSSALLLAGLIRAEMYGIGKLEYFLIDPNIEEVVINASNSPVYVYHRKYGWLKTNIYLPSEIEITNLSVKIARRIGKQITILNPLLDAHLIKGERANATLYPISVRGNTLTIRKFSEEPYSLPFLIQNGTLSASMASLLWQAEEFEMNILIVGGTASGKTTMLNALLMMSNPYRRVITIEDTREINLPKAFDNWVPLVTRSANPEGLGEVSLLDLMVNSLRMRPDKIIVGEVRKKEEALVLFEAMHTGHSVYSTFHADTAYIAMKRLQEEPISIPPQELEILDLVVTQRRNRKTGQRRTFEIAQTQVREVGTVVERIYTHRARTDTFDYNGIPIKYREKLSLYTGMTDLEIHRDLKEREKMLKFLIKKKMVSMGNVEKFIRLYYKEPDIVRDSIIKKGRLDI